MVAAPIPCLGALSAYEYVDETTHIGTRFPSAQLSRFLTASNSDELITDLATLVSHRGVVFFTEQDITLEQQKELANRMGKLSGRPATSELHRHPISESTSELGADVSVISSMG
jgi:Taurine catabolism dioxygenase TauD, TfdA family